jgi:hypothetical protein
MGKFSTRARLQNHKESESLKADIYMKILLQNTGASTFSDKNI